MWKALVNMIWSVRCHSFLVKSLQGILRCRFFLFYISLYATETKSLPSHLLLSAFNHLTPWTFHCWPCLITIHLDHYVASKTLNYNIFYYNSSQYKFLKNAIHLAMTKQNIHNNAIEQCDVILCCVNWGIPSASMKYMQTHNKNCDKTVVKYKPTSPLILCIYYEDNKL